MTKPEMISAMSAETGISKADTERMLNAFISVTQSALVAGKKVAVPGLGVFSVKVRAARMSRNPQTGEPVAVPAKNSVSFKPGKDLKRMVNE